MQLEAIAKMEFYHGTDLKNLKSISKRGLQARNGAEWSGGAIMDRATRAVYLTSDFPLAARYALGAARTQVPIVLEIEITSPRRFKHLRYDPMDRHDTAWDVEDSYDEDEQDVHSEIEDGIAAVAKELTGERHHIATYGLVPDELEDLDGFNVYKQATKYLMKALDLDRSDRRKVMNLAQKQWPEGYLGEYMEVRRDGTLKLTEEYYASREQLMYMKGLPPSTIKGVWFRIMDLDLPEKAYKGIAEHPAKDLPGEAADKFNSIKETLDRFRWGLGDYSAYDIRSAATELNEYGDDFDSLASVLKEYADALDEGSEDVDEIREEAEEEASNAGDWVYEDWGMDREGERFKWGKLPLNKAVQARRAINDRATT
jgi:hypothetical protein